MGNQFLPRPRLSGNQHIHVGFGHAAYLVEHRLHDGAAADDVAKRIRPFHLPLEQPLFVSQTLGFQQVAGGDQQFLRQKRFGEVVHRAEFHALHGTLHRGVSSEHEHGQLGIVLARKLKQLHPRQAGHPDVGDQQVEAFHGQTLRSTRTLLFGEHLRVRQLAQGIGAYLQHAQFVIHHQDACVSHARTPRAWHRLSSRWDAV
ncbi:MAG: hypothetical protein ABSE73_07305 [Planctomycetota bacterium]